MLSCAPPAGPWDHLFPHPPRGLGVWAGSGLPAQAPKSCPGFRYPHEYPCQPSSPILQPLPGRAWASLCPGILLPLLCPDIS